MSHLTWKDSELSGLIVYTPSYLNPALYKLAQLFETARKDNKYNYVEASLSSAEPDESSIKLRNINGERVGNGEAEDEGWRNETKIHIIPTVF
jgi:O-succinylbenzoate synthase